MSRFDYVEYDAFATDSQAQFKKVVEVIGSMIEVGLASPRAKSLALTRLEEVYMWIGKAIRDDQIERNGSAKLQEGRKDG